MSLRKQIGQSLIGRGFYFLTVLVMNIFLARYLQAGGAGWIFYLSNNFALIVILAGWTMENAVNYYSAKKIIDDNQLAWFSIVWSILISIIVFAGLACYLASYKNSILITPPGYLLYGICYVAGTQLTNFFSGLFYANKRFLLPNLLMIILNLILIITISFQPGTDNAKTDIIIRLYFALFVITGLTLAVAFMMTKQSWKSVSFPATVNIRLLIKYALLALSANVIFFLVYRVDYWFVKKYCSLQELGNYIQVSKLGQMLLIIPSVISSVVFPHTAGSGATPAVIKGNIMQIGRITTLLYCILFLVIAITGRWIFPFVFGTTFRLMYVPFLILLPGIWALSNLYILSAYFGGTNRMQVNVRGSVIALLVILAGDYLFIPAFGIVAAAMVSTIGYSVNFIYSFLIFKKHHRESFVKAG